MQSLFLFNPESGGSLLIDSFIANASGGETQVRNANVNTKIRIREGLEQIIGGVRPAGGYSECEPNFMCQSQMYIESQVPNW